MPLTFVNPAEGEVDTLPVGFYRGASARIPEMLIGMDVATPREGEKAISDRDTGIIVTDTA